jgi:hypothetical protein
VKQPILAHGLDRPDVMREEFIKNNFNMRKLLVQAIAMSASIGSRTEKNSK